MLVLTRKKNESIEIEGGIRVTVVDIRGDRVRIGVEAPGEISVHRQEVADAIRRERLAAVCPDCGCELIECRCQGGGGRVQCAKGGGPWLTL